MVNTQKTDVNGEKKSQAKVISFRLPLGLYTSFTAEAKKRGLSVGLYARELVRDILRMG